MKLTVPFRSISLGVSLTVGLASIVGCGSGGGGSGGAGGSTSGSGGAAPGNSGGATTPGSGGRATSSGGAPANTGGAPANSGGRGGSAANSGGRGGATANTGGQGQGGATGAGGAGSGDSFVSGVTVTVHPQTTTILVVTWTQARAADTTWLEFSFAGSTVMTSRAATAAAGAHRDVVLGVPEMTAVTLRIVNRMGGVDFKTRDYMGTTGAIPTGMPRPTILVPYNATLGSPARWMFGSVENSSGGCTTRACYFDGLFYVYIMDRQGRIVWYYVDASSNAATGFQRIARDGEYIWIEKSRTGTRGVTKMTLDRQYLQNIAAPIADAIDVTADGALLYDTNNALVEMNKAGTVRTIWSCRTAFGAAFNCYSNTINYNPADDTVLMSFPEPNTVVQINRTTGAIVGQYGDRAGSYTFMPANWSFEYQHFPNISATGTLMVSSHLPQFPDGSAAGPMQHGFQEFDIDRTNMRLVQRWVYSDGTEWPLSRGMVIKLPNGNYLGNYGTGGAIREITPDKQTVWHVKFDVPTGSDFANKMVGNNVLIDDLYALNGGGPQ